MRDEYSTFYNDPSSQHGSAPRLPLLSRRFVSVGIAFELNEKVFIFCCQACQVNVPPSSLDAPARYLYLRRSIWHIQFSVHVSAAIQNSTSFPFHVCGEWLPRGFRG